MGNVFLAELPEGILTTTPAQSTRHSFFLFFQCTKGSTTMYKNIKLEMAI